MTRTVTDAPLPKSPPAYPDFCGRHRLQVEVLSLNREIGFLEEELHSLDDTQPASRCCKEVNDFVGTNPDPLIPLNGKKHKSCRVWRWIRKYVCLNFSWICCSSKCSFKFRKPTCCSCNGFNKCCRSSNCDPLCCRCRCTHCCCLDLFKCFGCTNCCCLNLFNCFGCTNCFRSCKCSSTNTCFSCFRCRPSQCCSCCRNLFTLSCCRPSCSCPPRCSCPKCSCGCVLSCPDCTDACLCQCPKCTGPCCVTRCLCP